MSRGNITRRGERSWRIKYEAGRDPITGKRRTEFATVRGTKKDAQAELTRRLNEIQEGQFVSRSALTVAEYARHWLSTIAPARTSLKSRERYGEIIEMHIARQIGNWPLQKLESSHIEGFYTHLTNAGRIDGKGGLAPRTVHHIHRLLSQILSSAVKAKKLRQSPITAVQTTPKIHQDEIQVLDDSQLAMLFRHLKGRPLHTPVVLAASTGMRRGEVLALKWRDIDLDAATLRVNQVVEMTRAGLNLKEPKTNGSRRTIALPARLVQELRTHKKEQAEQRLRLGLGKNESDWVFPAWDWTIRNPSYFGKEFCREVAAAGLPRVTFHGLRHTHITHLLRSGVPVHVVSARAGHANPAITLSVYAHLLPGQQESAAAIVDASLRSALGE